MTSRRRPWLASLSMLLLVAACKASEPTPGPSLDPAPVEPSQGSSTSPDATTDTAAPANLDDSVAALVTVSREALAGCDAIFDADEGCYRYAHAFGKEWKRDRAIPIPGQIPSLEEGLLVLEAECTYDAARMVEEFPALENEFGGTPNPGTNIGCHYLPVGDLDETTTEFSYVPGPDPEAGEHGAGVVVEVWVPADVGASGRVIRVNVERQDERGRTVKLEALLRGSA